VKQRQPRKKVRRRKKDLGDVILVGRATKARFVEGPGNEEQGFGERSAKVRLGGEWNGHPDDVNDLASMRVGGIKKNIFSSKTSAAACITGEKWCVNEERGKVHTILRVGLEKKRREMVKLDTVKEHVAGKRKGGYEMI